MKKIVFLLLSVVFVSEGFSQSVGISESTFTPSTQAILDLTSDRRGFLPPRMELNGDDLPINGTKPTGLMVHNVGGAIGPDGLYYWTGSAWTQITTTSSSIGGSGTLNYVPKFTPNGMTIGNSSIFDDGNVGINTTSPATKLNIRSGSNSTTLTDYTQNISDKHGLVLTSTYNDGTLSPGLFWNTSNDNPTKPKAGIFLQMTNLGSKLAFATSTTYATGITNTAMVVDDMGNVGIGNITPGNRLSTQRDPGASSTADFRMSDGGQWMFHNTNQSAGAWNPMVQAGDHAIIYSDGSQNTGSLTIGPWSNANAGIRLKEDGNVGVGTSAPTQKLDVNGKIRMRTGAAAGYVPVSDASGNMTWTNPSSLSTSNDGDWTISGSNQYSAVAGNVGIGTTNPLRKLHVSGGGEISLLQGSSVSTDSQAGIYWHTATNYGIYRGPGAWTGPDYQQLTLDWPTGIVLNPGVSYGKSYVDVQGGGLMVTSGNIGVGTTSPAQSMHATGNVRFDGRYAYFGANQSLYGDGSSALYWNNNHANTTQIILRDAQNTQYGRIYGNGDGTNFGLMDGDGNWSYLAAKDSYTAFRINNSEKVRITSGGNVGIGTSSPADRLQVNGHIRASGMLTGTPDATYGNGGRMRDRGNDNGFSVDWVGSQLRFYIENVWVKTFIIDHPDDKDKYLIHTTLEGPENGVYYRGSAKLSDGKAEVELPDYFNSLTQDGSATVILTSKGKKPYLLSYDEFEGNQFKVYGDCEDCEFDWEVKAKRQDVPDLFIEPNKDEVVVSGNGPYKHYGVIKKTGDASTSEK